MFLHIHGGVVDRLINGESRENTHTHAHSRCPWRMAQLYAPLGVLLFVPLFFVSISILLEDRTSMLQKPACDSCPSVCRSFVSPCPSLVCRSFLPCSRTANLAPTHFIESIDRKEVYSSVVTSFCWFTRPLLLTTFRIFPPTKPVRVLSPASPTPPRALPSFDFRCVEYRWWMQGCV